MASYNPKMAEWFCGARSVPIIISGKSKSWVLAVGGKTVKGKVLHINQSQPQALPNYQMKHYRSLFNWPKPSGALPKVSEQHLKKSQKVQDSQYVPFPPPRMVRLSDLESAWKCSRSDGLEMRIPKVTLKSQIGHLEPVLGNVEKSKIWTIFNQTGRS